LLVEGVATHAGQLLVTLAIGFAATGCAVLGPKAIKSGRGAYNDALVTTNSQQVLGMIVRMRYGEPTGLLAVSSVTANLHVQTRVGSEFGFGPDSNYEGNLTPLSAGIAYEENPTISYAPVQGERYLRQILSPLPMDLMVPVLSTLGRSTQTMTLLIRSINGIQNPDFLAAGSDETDPRFARLVALLAELGRAGCSTWAQEPGAPPSFVLALDSERPACRQQVEELYGLLGFAAPRDLDDVINLPVQSGIGKPRKAAIQLSTRSLYDLFSIAAASVEVPEEHLESGLATRLPPAGEAGQSIRIQRSEGCPRRAMIAVKRHGWWYSIDATDSVSKLTFRLLEALMSVRIAEAARRRTAPVLTVPVSR